uniref:Uncharacterized protein n=1 Tax=Arundo donax TaxID=35708 RepID=A0A0A9G8D9_ARUDO
MRGETPTCYLESVVL